MISRVRCERALRNDHLIVVLELLRRDVERKTGPARRDELGCPKLHVLSGRVHDHDRVAVRARAAGGDRARRFLPAPRGRDVRLHVRRRTNELDRTNSEVVDDVADVAQAAVQLGVTPADRRRVRMHQAEPVIRRVPELANAAELRTARRDLAHERRCPTLRNQSVARPVPGVVREARGLVVTEGAVRAVVVRVVLRGLHETRVRRYGRRTGRGAELVGEQEHVVRRRLCGRRERNRHESQTYRKAHEGAQKRGARENPPHRY